MKPLDPREANLYERIAFAREGLLLTQVKTNADIRRLRPSKATSVRQWRIVQRHYERGKPMTTKEFVEVLAWRLRPVWLKWILGPMLVATGAVAGYLLTKRGKAA